MRQAREYYDALSFFEPTVRLAHFPDYEVLPYDLFSPQPEIISQRLLTLYHLPDIESGFVIVPIQTLLQKIPPRDFVLPRVFELTVDEPVDIRELSSKLINLGYRRVDSVYEHGEIAVRGSILDFFPMGASSPIRLDFFDNIIETLRHFDPDTQRTTTSEASVRVMPAHQYPLDNESITKFRNGWNDAFQASDRLHPIYRDISEAKPVEGIENYLPLFFDSMPSLLEYTNDSSILVISDRVDEAASEFLQTVDDRYETHQHDINRPLLPPKRLFLSMNELHAQWNKFTRINICLDDQPRKHSVSLGGKQLPNLELETRRNEPARRVRDFLANSTAPVLLTAETQGRLQHLTETLERVRVKTEKLPSYRDFQHQKTGIFATVGALQEGLWTDDQIIITEAQILGGQTEYDRFRHRRRGRNLDPDDLIRNLTELHPGAPVVHIDHGVGRYVGLETLSHRSQVTEFVTLEYADGDRLYVPVSSLHLISRFTGTDEEHAPLHKLGSDAWANAKKRAAQRIYDVAAELLNIYARRASTKSIRFPSIGTDYATFCDQCEFELTPDQVDATTTVLEDLCKTKATDRLICGDVGFGKTEVAMRAAFHVVQSGFQVVVLVPTTILAQQHFETFSDRFANWPYTIELISRFRTDTEIQQTREKIESGATDIVIGTHKLLHTRFHYKQLGLLVIDEEHRFGVRDKERIKNIKAAVDTITLTATPIPRTLNLSMGGLRDLSIITTPPAKRLAVKTFVMPFNRHTVQDALKRELARGGQVFFLHNKVETIFDAYEGLQKLVPDARLAIGHGQMKKRELERVMSNFYHRKTNVLVCTTIIESGIDIPNANTIIIDRADKFGLAQLHQLRGRVGRSTRQAYAYLLIPPDSILTIEAKKRLDAIEKSDELGSGFTLAVHDLEIRGAGELLGQQQHGQLETIGFTLYMQMLNQTVESLKRGDVPNFDDPLPMTHEVNLHTSTLFPPEYLPNIHTRLVLYKRMSAIESQHELNAFKIEVIDRFGPLPMPTEHLFRNTYLKLQAQRLGINKINLNPDSGRIEFSRDNKVDPLTLASVLSRYPATFRLAPNDVVRILKSSSDVDERFELVENFIRQLQRTKIASNA